MQRIDTATKATDLFGAGKHGFKDGNKGLGIAATELNAAIFNAVQEEICNVIEGQGIILDPSNRAQLDAALKTLLSKATITSAGAAPTFTLTPAPAITAYSAGQRYRVKFHASGTTGSNTLNISGIGAKSLKQYDAAGAKVAGIAVSGQIADIEYDGADLVILDKVVPQGTGSALGLLQLASNAEALGGVEATKAVTSAGLASAMSLAANGYMKFPGGLIVQWGFANIQDDQYLPVTFPIAFPSSCYAGFAAPTYNAAITGSYSMGAHVFLTGLTGMNIGVSMVYGTAITGVYWLSIGK